MDSLAFECNRQKKFEQKLRAEGYSCADDPANLEAFIGTLREVECYCQSFTPTLLAKLYPPSVNIAESPEKFWLVPVWQIVRYGNLIPKVGGSFSSRFVIGCRKISPNGFVPALRLPLK